MARRFIRVNSDLLNNPKAQLLSPGKFKREVMAAAHGEPSVLSDFIVPEPWRVFEPGWRKVRSEVFARDDYTCVYCGTRGGRLECDHVFPASRGGSDDKSNLVTACRPCNRAKRDKTPDEWMAA